MHVGQHQVVHQHALGLAGDLGEDVGQPGDRHVDRQRRRRRQLADQLLGVRARAVHGGQPLERVGDVGGQRHQAGDDGVAAGIAFGARQSDRHAGDQRLVGQRVALDQVAPQRTPAKGQHDVVDLDLALLRDAADALEVEAHQGQLAACRQAAVEQGFGCGVHRHQAVVGRVAVRIDQAAEGLAQLGHRLQVGLDLLRLPMPPVGRGAVSGVAGRGRPLAGLRRSRDCDLDGLVEAARGGLLAVELDRPVRRQVARTGIGAGRRLRQFDAPLPVHQRVMDAREGGVAAAAQPLDQVLLPQRPRAVERVAVQPRDQLEQFALAAGVGQCVVKDMLVEVDLVEHLPRRHAQTAARAGEAVVERRAVGGEAQHALAQLVHEIRPGAARQLQHLNAADVHRRLRRLHQQQPGIEHVHRLELHVRPRCCWVAVAGRWRALTGVGGHGKSRVGPCRRRLTAVTKPSSATPTVKPSTTTSLQAPTTAADALRALHHAGRSRSGCCDRWDGARAPRASSLPACGPAWLPG